MKFVIPLVAVLLVVGYLAYSLGLYLPSFPRPIILLIGAVAHIVFASKVYDDATKRVDALYLGIPPWTWSLLVLVMGIFGLFFYWLFHDSTRNSRRS